MDITYISVGILIVIILIFLIGSDRKEGRFCIYSTQCQTGLKCKNNICGINRFEDSETDHNRLK